jgi:hypothetical protein
MALRANTIARVLLPVAMLTVTFFVARAVRAAAEPPRPIRSWTSRYSRSD